MANGDINTLLQGFLKSFTNTGVIIVLVIAVGAIIFSIIYYFVFYRRKFDILVKIYSERSNDPKIYFDKAAILTERKTGKKYLRLLKSKCELAIPPFKILTNTNYGDYLELRRVSEDEFRFITNPYFDKVKYVGLDGKVYPVTRLVHKNIESDINFIIERKTKNKKLIDPESMLMKLLEYAPQIISGMFILIILYVFMDKLPSVMDSMEQLLIRTDDLIKTINQTQQVNYIRQ